MGRAVKTYGGSRKVSSRGAFCDCGSSDWVGRGAIYGTGKPVWMCGRDCRCPPGAPSAPSAAEPRLSEGWPFTQIKVHAFQLPLQLGLTM